MTDTYFVCFQGGTSGRFISTIVWNLINNIQKTIDFGEYNSAHGDSFWCLSWDTVTKSHHDNNLPNVFSTIKFLRNQPSELNPNGFGLLNTHAYPDFEVIGERFPNSKIIIISLDYDDVMEIAANNVIKNIVQTFSYKSGDYKKIMGTRVVALMQHYLGNDVDIDAYDFSKMDLEPVVRLFHQRLMAHFNFDKTYIRPFVPDEWKDRTTIIKYSDIYRKTINGYHGLETLEHLTNTKANATILQTYTNYVNGREKLIREKLPWIKL